MAVDPIVVAAQGSAPKSSSTPQDQELQEKLKVAAPAWIKDGKGLAGNQLPKTPMQLPDYSGGNVKPLSMNVSTSVSPKGLYGSASGGGSGKKVAAFPYQCVLSSDSKTSQDYVTVNTDSYLFLSFTPDDDYTVSGLGKPIAVDIGDIVWIEIKFARDTGEVAMASIMATSTGSFDPSAYIGSDDAFVEYQSDGKQVLARKLLCRVTEDAKGDTAIDQITYNHLIIQTWCLNGYATLYPVPY